MASLRIVGFASGSPQSQAAMARIAREHHLAAIVVPPPHRGARQLLHRLMRKPTNPLAQLGAPIVAEHDIARFRPDLIVVASFPRILPLPILAAAQLGALNFHMSLLPRHRGADPVFWTYWDDDRYAGVTVHWMNKGVDAGDVAAREPVPLDRGRPSRELYMQLTSVGVEMLSAVLANVASGKLVRQPQDRSLATYRSAAEVTRARIPFAQWPAERVWHVLSGLGDQFHHLLADTSGHSIAHGRAKRYAPGKNIEPGRIVTVNADYELHCSDGIVLVESKS